MSVSLYLQNLVYERDGHRCSVCRRSLKPDQARVEHVVPAGRGGSESPVNLVLVCKPCSLKKGFLKIEERFHPISFQ
jgi:5-methylcytosine-specific restriction endonuclease McrA